MRITEAQEMIGNDLGHEVELIQAKRMHGDILVVITEDTTELGGKLPIVRTRRLSIFRGHLRFGMFVIDADRFKK